MVNFMGSVTSVTTWRENSQIEKASHSKEKIICVTKSLSRCHGACHAAALLFAGVTKWAHPFRGGPMSRLHRVGAQKIFERVQKFSAGRF